MNCRCPVPAALWGCRAHWYALPQRLRNRIWATYRPGQEVTKTPSPEYIAVAHEVQEWIRQFSDGLMARTNAQRRKA